MSADCCCVVVLMRGLFLFVVLGFCSFVFSAFFVGVVIIMMRMTMITTMTTTITTTINYSFVVVWFLFLFYCFGLLVLCCLVVLFCVVCLFGRLRRTHPYHGNGVEAHTYKDI